ncbi:MAG: hypothetical protein HWN67_13510 [Candidatus Helarchaeota archaeon]|nr:hypothetical protein [Candidatus Helarchaeota archaeon]
MKLVLDSNRFFAAFIKDSKSRDILLHDMFEFYAPVEILEEIEKYKDFLIKKSKLNSNSFAILFISLFKSIILVSFKNYKKELDNAREIMQNIDIKDAPFIALGIALHLDGIWTEDKHLFKQKKLKAYSTKDLLAIIKDKQD